MLTKLLSIIIVLIFPVFIFSQKRIISDITFYIKNVYLDDSSYVKKIPIDYDIFYPMYQPVTKWVTLQRKSIFISVNVSNNNIIIDGNPVLVENGDTIYTRVEKRNTRITLTDKNNQLLFYNKIWQSDFSKSRVYPTSKLNESDFPFYSYKDYCLTYFAEERQFIDSLFGGKRPKVKERLLNASKNSELIALISPYAYRNIVNKSYKVQIDTIVVNEKIRLDHFQVGYLIDPSYRDALSQINLIQSNITVQNAITVSDYNELYKHAIKGFSKDASTYLLITYLRRIVRSSNGSYKSVIDSIHSQLTGLNLDKKTKYQIDSLYKDFNLLVTNINLFKNVEVRNAKGQMLKLGTIFHKGTPILLDFWATWCAPCLTEIPYLDTVQKYFPDIQIISLSIDKNEDKWFKFTKGGHAFNNSSYLLINPNKSLIVQKYKIENIPKFLLYEENGNCLSLDLIRPSEKSFIEAVKNFLKK